MKTPSKALIFSILLGVVLWVYVILRAYFLAFTPDESSSYTDIHYMSLGYFFGSIANTHLLNTFSMILIKWLLGCQPFYLRLPNILSYLIYLYFAYQIVKDNKHSIFQIGAFIFLNTHHFVIDFFSLARGYGMALAMMMGSLYYLKKIIESTHPRVIHKQGLYIVFLLSSLCLSANYTWLNFYLSLWLIIYVRLGLFSKQFWTVLIKHFYLICLQGVFLSFIFMVLVRLKINNMLYVGGTEGFWKDTIASILEGFLYLSRYNFLSNLLEIGFALFIIVNIAFLTFIITRQKLMHNFYLITLLISVISVSFNLLQFFILNTPLPQGRTSIYLIPLVQIWVIFFFKEIMVFKDTIKLLITKVTFILLVSLAGFHFLRVANFNWVKYGNESLDIPEVVKDLRALSRQQDTKIQLGISYFCTVSINYYRLCQQLDFLAPCGFVTKFEKGKDAFYSDEVLTGDYDYLYFLENEKTNIEAQTPIRIIKYYPLTKSYLAELIKDK